MALMESKISADIDHEAMVVVSELLDRVDDPRQSALDLLPSALLVEQPANLSMAFAESHDVVMDDDEDEEDDDDFDVHIDAYEQNTPTQESRRHHSNSTTTGSSAVDDPSTASTTVLLTSQARSHQIAVDKGVDVDAPGIINGVSTLDYDLNQLKEDEKPWRKPGADITDYFNYGFNEETWLVYCIKQRRLRAENQQMTTALQSTSAALSSGLMAQLFKQKTPSQLSGLASLRRANGPGAAIGVIGATDETSRRAAAAVLAAASQRSQVPTGSSNQTQNPFDLSNQHPAVAFPPSANNSAAALNVAAMAFGQLANRPPPVSGVTGHRPMAGPPSNFLNPAQFQQFAAAFAAVRGANFPQVPPNLQGYPLGTGQPPPQRHGNPNEPWDNPIASQADSKYHMSNTGDYNGLGMKRVMNFDKHGYGAGDINDRRFRQRQDGNRWDFQQQQQQQQQPGRPPHDQRSSMSHRQHLGAEDPRNARPGEEVNFGNSDGKVTPVRRDRKYPPPVSSYRHRSRSPRHSSPAPIAPPPAASLGLRRSRSRQRSRNNRSRNRSRNHSRNLSPRHRNDYRGSRASPSSAATPSRYRRSGGRSSRHRYTTAGRSRSRSRNRSRSRKASKHRRQRSRSGSARDRDHRSRSLSSVSSARSRANADGNNNAAPARSRNNNNNSSSRKEESRTGPANKKTCSSSVTDSTERSKNDKKSSNSNNK